MNYLALLPVLEKLIDRILPDKEKQAQAKNELQSLLNEAEAKRLESNAKIAESQAKVIVAEATGKSYSARNWRPHLMYALMLIVPYNWILAPLLASFGLDLALVPIPDQYWTLLTVGLGGYIGRDMVTTYSDAKFNNKKFFDVIRDSIFKGKMTEEQVAAINDALEKAKR